MVLNLLVFAFNNIRRRGLRSWLTMIGIFIGVAAVVSLVSLGQGLEQAVKEQFAQIGADTITILGRAGFIVSPAASAILEDPLTEKDVELIEDIRDVDLVASSLFQSSQMEFKGEKRNTLMWGFPPENLQEIFKDVTSFEVVDGRDLRDEDKFKVVIGNDVAKKVFNKPVKIRDKLEINGQEFEVVGILKKVGNAPDDQSIYMPLGTMREIFNEPELVSIIYVKVKAGNDPTKVAQEIEKDLRDKRNEDEGEESFVVTTSEQLLETVGNILGIVSAVLIGIAAISLVVGGIGIANTMYTAVLERTREIGVMKAVGAKNFDIMLIFLFESGVLGLVGGVLGVVLGIGIGKLVEFIATQQLGTFLLRASFSPLLIVGTLLFAFIVGTISGFLPARQAALLKPVEALRY